MKKIISMALLAAMVLSCFAGCAMQKGEIEVDAYAAEANVQDVALTVPTTVPTTNVSKWTGTEIPSGSINSKTGLMSGISVTIDTNGDYSKNTVGLEGADITWFNPNETTHYLNDAADLAGFLVLRQFTTYAPFKEAYKDITGKDLNYFDGHTFILKVNVDMSGANIKNYNSAFMFGGTFDGGNHAIFNYKMTGITSGSKGFFSKLTGNACVMNFSLLNGECVVASSAADAVTKQSDGTYKLETGQKNSFGFAVGVVETVSGKTITVSNIYTDCKVSSNATDSSKNVFVTVGGIVGQVNGKGKAIVDNCASASTFKLDNTGFTNTTLTSDKKSYTVDKNYGYGLYTGGVVARVTGSVETTISNCSFSGEIVAANTDVAGIVANVTSTGATQVTKCVNNATVKGTTRVAGIIAYYNAKGTLTVTECVNNGDLTGAGGYVGGIIGRAQNVVTLKIENCTTTAEATLDAGVNSAGIIGYIDGDSVVDVDILNCSFAGVLNTGRGSGGIAGYPHGKNSDFTMTGCVVTGTLNLNAADTSNNSLGGLIGRFDAKTAVISDCTFNGVLNANFDPKFAEDKSNHCTAGGLIGYVFNASNAAGALELVLSNNKVSGTLNFTDENRDDVATVEPERADRAIYVAYVANSAKVTYSELSTGENLNVTGGKALVNMNGADIAVVGYQVKDNGDTYNLRYVATVDAPAENAGIGFIVSIYKKDGGEKVAIKEDVVSYAKVIYKTINGGGETYVADDFYADYLYTLEIQGIPAGYSVENGNLEIVITPFTAVETEVEVDGEVTEVVTTNNSSTAQHGAILIK